MINENKTIAFWNKKLLRGCRLFRHRFRLRCLNRFNISPVAQPAVRRIYIIVVQYGVRVGLLDIELVSNNLFAEIVVMNGNYTKILP